MTPALEVIPEHLREYITAQDPNLYTSIDQAVWRYVMRVSRAYFAEHGHPLYNHGIIATGMSTERIPLVDEMDRALRKMGWRAVAINGFIPPAIFLEFQSLRILAIACDIRKLENLGYTPSPDIIHEAAGHAPIVADPGYRAYLEAYGEVARNALISRYDLDLYDAILKLSDIKEDPHSDPAAVAAAQAHFEELSAQESVASEAAVLTRMAWWTTEYGLIERDGRPVVYGAGLLSSVSESFNCLKPEVQKIPFSLKGTLETSYDITRQQPQLFVAKNFDELTRALNEFADTMAYRRGGVYGLEQAEISQNTATVVFENGIQVTGIVSNVQTTVTDENSSQESMFTLSGTKQISFHDQASNELSTHHLSAKIVLPLFDKSVVTSTLGDLQRKLHGSGLHTISGHRVLGRFKKEVTLGTYGKILLLEHAKILDSEGKVVFEDHQRSYPLILASKVVSVFGGAADRKAFVVRNSKGIKKVTSHKTNLTSENLLLNDLYHRVREFRESAQTNTMALEGVILELNRLGPQDWLLRVELLELFEKLNPASIYTAQLRGHLTELSRTHPEWCDLISRGVALTIPSGGNA